MSRTTGIEVRHEYACPARTGAAREAGIVCRCKPAYQANVWSRRDNKRIRKTFPTLSAAKAWRSEALVALRAGTMRSAPPVTLREAADAFIAGAKDGTIRNRKKQVYKPSVARAYEQCLRDHVLPALGAAKLADIQRRDLQDLADRLLAEGRDPSTVRNALAPVRAICRRALSRGELSVNPTSGLELASPEGKRDRIASPSEATELLEALPKEDRPLWATALYAGLRRGELMALRIEDLDLAGGVIRVERSYDPKARMFVSPKSRAGKRTVPIAAVLRDYLLEHKLRLGRSEGLFFGATADRPFTSSNVSRRAATAWRKAGQARTAELGIPMEEAGFEPIGLHECRHTFASLMIAAAVNAKALSTYMGHSSISITLDRYGHMFPGNEEEAASLLDAYLERANTKGRLAQVGATA